MKHYSEEHIKFLTDYFPGHSHREIVEEFNKRFPGMDFGVNNSKYIQAKYHLYTGRTGRFEKGRTSHNKGKKGWCAPGSEKGWFKKGGVSLNHLPIGSIRLRHHHKRESPPEYFIKVAEPNKWQLYNRWLWENEVGPIPEGYVVAFKNGDSLDVRIDNLKLVSRAAMIQVAKNNSLEMREVQISRGELFQAIRRRESQ